MTRTETCWKGRDNFSLPFRIDHLTVTGLQTLWPTSNIHPRIQSQPTLRRKKNETVLTKHAIQKMVLNLFLFLRVMWRKIAHIYYVGLINILLIQDYHRGRYVACSNQMCIVCKHYPMFSYFRLSSVVFLWLRFVSQINNVGGWEEFAKKRAECNP